MKKLNLKGLTPSSITTVVVLLIALINAVLQIFGINTIPVTNDEVSEIVSILFLIVTSLYSTYKNFNVTSASQTAQNITDAIKNGELVADDIEEILKISRTALQLSDDTKKISPVTKKPVRIAVARDKAFCFYYEDNFEILRDLGAELVEFSPISDSCIPENTDGLYLGGGYPELHITELSNNANMRNSIKNAIKKGLPTIAECGGFLYLHEHLEGAEMVGVVRGNAVLTKKLQPFGYVTLTAQDDNLLSACRGQIRAHEFHYAKSENAGHDFVAEKPNGRKWPCVHATKSLYAGFPHLFFRANIDFSEKFVRTCMEWSERRK